MIRGVLYQVARWRLTAAWLLLVVSAATALTALTAMTGRS